jgi:hypothetical protein
MTERRYNNQNNENRKPHTSYHGNNRRPYKRPNKSLVVIKSTVFALGIVLVTLVATLALVKNQKFQKSCKNNILSIKDKAEIIKSDETSLLLKVVTKRHIEIIRIKNDNTCPKILNKIQIKNN